MFVIERAKKNETVIFQIMMVYLVRFKFYDFLR